MLIYRVPKGEDFIYKRSYCPSCGKKISWYENIPLLSYIGLRGRCSECKTKISWRYPLVELACGIFAALLFPSSFHIHGIFLFILNFAIFCSLITLFWIDIDHMILPNKINIYLFALILIRTLMYGNPMAGLVGALMAVFLTGSVAYIFYKVKGIEGLGMGDIKLYGVLGFALGPVGVSLNIFLSCLLGVFIFVLLSVLKKIDKQTPIAFGPFIIVVAVFQIFFPKSFGLISSFLVA